MNHPTELRLNIRAGQEMVVGAFKQPKYGVSGCSGSIHPSRRTRHLQKEKVQACLCTVSFIVANLLVFL